MSDRANKMLVDWSDDHTQAFRKSIISFKHRLNETGLFTDDALSELIERHPKHLIDVCTMGQADDPRFPNKFRTGDFRDCSGEDLINAAKAGCVWINLREAMNVDPAYKSVLDTMYGELAEHTNNETFKARGGILISSPVAQVPYHFDKTETILWHVRGKKRIRIYPCTQKFISDESFEHSLTQALDDDLPYSEGFEASAQIYDLEENQAITWPMNSPHRVDNSAFCVSVTTEYSTRESALKNSAMIANHFLRTRLGMSPAYNRSPQYINNTKAVLGLFIRKFLYTSIQKNPDMVTFKIDPKKSNFMSDISPFVRNF